MVEGGRYGFMRDVEEDLIDRILDKLKAGFEKIAALEVGVFSAGTVRGIYRRAKEIDCPVECSGVDFEKYRPNPTPDLNYKFYAGDSMDMHREIKDKFNFLFIDGCHCCNHAICDFCNYSPMVEVNGLCLFHDTALPTSLGKDIQEEWPQDHSYAGKPSSVLGVREGLKKLGLLQGYRSDWKLIEEIPSETGLMGACLFQKVKEL